MKRLLGYPRLALAARLHDGAWRELDTWHPRCDPRIPLRPREPSRSVGCSPGQARIPWVRNAIKWHLSVLLESGALTWSTLTNQRSQALLRFARWLESLPDPAAAVRDPLQAGVLAADFRCWACDPGNRSSIARPPGEIPAGKVNLDLWSVAGLMDFLDVYRPEATRILGPSPWDALTSAHPAIWLRQRARLRRRAPLADEARYVDDHALAQVTACLPALGEPAGQVVTVTSGGSTRMMPGQDDPQLMRMLLLQILTGRRASEICPCPFGCLSPATGSAISAAEGEAVARFRYGQSKIDAAPGTILVDAETVAVITEQQQWLRDRFPGRELPYLFPQRRANAHTAKPYGNTNYGRSLALFSDLAQITDAAGHPVKLSHTHRFRHTKLTTLAELWLPVHVLQRYAGHSTPTMSMHYVARRDEHAEQAFLATRKLRVDGTAVTFSRADHDALHLLDRADRFLPNGWCLLPPLQRCEKGNACLTCAVFVTDDSHLAVLQRQLEDGHADRAGHRPVPRPARPPHARRQRLAHRAQGRMRRADQAPRHDAGQPGPRRPGSGQPQQPGPRDH